LSGVPTALDPLTIEKTLEWIRSNLDGTPSAEQLRAVRAILDDATFVPVLKEALKRRIGHNSGISIPNELSALMRLAEERRDQKETHRGWVNQFGLAGSGALVFGGILACLNPAIGVLAIIPVAGGIFVAGTSCFGMKRLDEERTLYRQLAERLSEIRKAMTE
jgi:hypothetical protein